eukprot:6231736-Prymnesium_polylepis.1
MREILADGSNEGGCDGDMRPRRVALSCTRPHASDTAAGCATHLKEVGSAGAWLLEEEAWSASSGALADALAGSSQEGVDCAPPPQERQPAGARPLCPRDIMHFS